MIEIRGEEVVENEDIAENELKAEPVDDRVNRADAVPLAIALNDCESVD